jgi:hypothetical protein
MARSRFANAGCSFHLERAWLYRLGAILWCGESNEAK